MSSFFGLGTKENNSSTTNQTTNTYTDTSANAGGDGSLAASQGSSISIQTSDPQTVARALATVDAANAGAINLAAAQARDNSEQFVAALNTLKSADQQNNLLVGDTQKAAQATIEAAQNFAQGISSQVAQSKEPTDVKLAQSSQNTIVYVAAAAAVAITAFFIFRRR